MVSSINFVSYFMEMKIAESAVDIGTTSCDLVHVLVTTSIYLYPSLKIIQTALVGARILVSTGRSNRTFILAVTAVTDSRRKRAIMVDISFVVWDFWRREERSFSFLFFPSSPSFSLKLIHHHHLKTQTLCKKVNPL